MFVIEEGITGKSRAHGSNGHQGGDGKHFFHKVELRDNDNNYLPASHLTKDKFGQGRQKAGGIQEVVSAEMGDLLIEIKR